ncbi:hypothetical protein Hdeb2414_s0003g00089611 [Helianthus debilis subsp. tardiflorus]
MSLWPFCGDCSSWKASSRAVIDVEAEQKKKKEKRKKKKKHQGKDPLGATCFTRVNSKSLLPHTQLATPFTR